MTAIEVLNELQKHGHGVGRSTVAPDGRILLNVDDRLYTVPEAKDLMIGKNGLTTIERKVIDLLIIHPPTADPWGEPILFVDQVMGWAPSDTKNFVEDLCARQLVHHTVIAPGPRKCDRKTEWRETANK